MSLVLLDILLLMVVYLFHYCSLAGEDFLHGIGLTIAWLFCICIIILKSYLKEKSIHSSAVILYNLDRIVNWQLTLSEWHSNVMPPAGNISDRLITRLHHIFQFFFLQAALSDLKHQS